MIRLSRRAVVAGVAALGACSVLPARPYQERREWPLDVQRPTTVPASPSRPVLLVREVGAAPGLDARGLRTLLPEGAEHLDYWEEWAVPPSQGVASCLRGWLAASGRFGAVVSPGSDLSANLVLESELLAFVGEPGASRARVVLSLVLLRRGRAGHDSPLLQRVVTGAAPLSGTDAPALTASLRAALGRRPHPDGSVVGALRGHRRIRNRPWRDRTAAKGVLSPSIRAC